MLAVKSAMLATLDPWGNEYEALKSSYQLRPFLISSREIRAKLMRVMPELLDAMMRCHLYVRPASLRLSSGDLPLATT
jgi:hypothetical protein